MAIISFDHVETYNSQGPSAVKLQHMAD